MPGTIRRFGAFEADLAAGELRRDGARVRIQDLPFRLLAALLERPGEVVPRADLAAQLWGDATYVDADAGLNTAVAKLREALGDSAEAPRFIDTVPKRGYRFLAPVEAGSATGPIGAAGTSAVRRPRPVLLGASLLAAVAVLVAFVVLGVSATPAAVRLAVVLFDNETADPELDRLAQVLTDSVVTALAANPRLAVIGNAAVLRSPRPFRDLEMIGETLDADLVVIGQVQRIDDKVRVLTHLIRTSDQAHVWVQPTPLAADGEAALARAVVTAVDDAVRRQVDAAGAPAR